MVRKKNMTRRRASSRARRSRTKKLRKKESLFASLRPETKHGVVVVVFVALGILSILGLRDGAGRAGAMFGVLADRLFGDATILIPIAFLLVAGVVLRFIHKRVHTSAMIGTLIMVLSVLGIVHLAFPENQRGGFLGLAVSYPFEYAIGFWASIVVFMSAAVIAVLVTFNISLRRVVESEEEEGGEIEKESVSAEAREMPLAENEQKALAEKTRRSPLKRLAALFSRSGQEHSFETHTMSDDAAHSPSVDESNDVPKEDEAGFDGRSGDGDNADVGMRSKRRPDRAYATPSIDLLEFATTKPSTGDIKANATIIQRTLQNFGIEVEMGEVNVGPTVTQYTLRPATGVKLAKIVALQKDLSLALAAHPIRIEAPIPGRSLVGIEVPNTSVSMVRLGALLRDESFDQAKRSMRLPLALGRDVAGNPIWADVAKMPHLLVAGATGSGKSVCINTILTTLLYQFSPRELRLILVDPKRVELPLYNGIPHLLSPVIVHVEKVPNALRWALAEMEERYELLAEIGSRDIGGYNSRSSGGSRESLPYIVIVIDELADIMASYGREVEGAIVRLAQMSRAVGIHLIVSTQRPSVEVITGLIKANITSRIAFQVASQVDSRTILDQAGAEKLLGNGDMLFLSGDAAHPRRIQSAFVGEKEVKRVVSAIRVSEDNLDFEDEVVDYHSPSGSGVEDLEDDRYEEARAMVLETRQASASFLQRRMKVGYARAARLIDMLEQQDVIGPQRGAKPREILVDVGGNSGVVVDEESVGEI